MHFLFPTAIILGMGICFLKHVTLQGKTYFYRKIYFLGPVVSKHKTKLCGRIQLRIQSFGSLVGCHLVGMVILTQKAQLGPRVLRTVFFFFFFFFTKSGFQQVVRTMHCLVKLWRWEGRYTYLYSSVARSWFFNFNKLVLLQAPHSSWLLPTILNACSLLHLFRGML